MFFNTTDNGTLLVISVGGGGRRVQPPRNPFHSGKFSERTIGNSGNFSAHSPVLFDISGRKFTAPLN